jgi:hypothetical protein
MSGDIQQIFNNAAGNTIAQQLDDCITELQAAMTMQVSVRTDFGVKRIYPACELSRVFAELLTCKSFTQFQIRHMRKLGYEFVVTAPHSELLGDL